MIRLHFTLLLIALVGCQNVVDQKEAPGKISAAMCSPITSDSAWYQENLVAPLFEDLGRHHYPIQTDNPLVQQYFNQGLVLAYGFNHAEAARSFYYAAKLDPQCAMAYWGFAYVLGPNYNAGMEPDHYERAYTAIQKAIQLSKENGNQKESDLIVALASRYVENPVDDRSELDQRYAEHMKSLFETYNDDPDIAALYAESLMNLHPWDLWTADGEAKEWTPQILEVLEHTFTIAPEPPGAHHFYIHAVEASGTPQKGYLSAKLFDDGLVPNSGHLVHMPSHIYIRTGDYHKGTLANINAIRVDSTYVTACHAQGAYPLAYYPHNQHFLAGTATLEGNSQWALFAADAIAENSNRQLMKEPGWSTVQHFYTIPFFVYVKFARWDDILKMENEVPDLIYPEAVLTYARGMAFAGKGNISAAELELKKLTEFAHDESLRELTIWDINSVFDIVSIAEKVLAAEILAKQKKYEASIVLLEEAIKIEDNLNYNEPPDWFFSVRHNLGAVLFAAGLHEQAAKTYLEDLKHFPENGWALNGLSLAYGHLENADNEKDAQQRFEKAWAHADVELEGSRIK